MKHESGCVRADDTPRLFPIENGRTRTLNVSCQRLHLIFVEATTDEATASLINQLQTGVANANRFKLRTPAWLTREDFKRVLTQLIDGVRAQRDAIEISWPRPALKHCFLAR